MADQLDDLVKVADLAGHTDTRTTEGYRHAVRPSLPHAVEAGDGLLARAAEFAVARGSGWRTTILLVGRKRLVVPASQIESVAGPPDNCGGSDLGEVRPPGAS